MNAVGAVSLTTTAAPGSATAAKPAVTTTSLSLVEGFPTRSTSPPNGFKPPFGEMISARDARGASSCSTRGAPAIVSVQRWIGAPIGCAKRKPGTIEQKSAATGGIVWVFGYASQIPAMPICAPVAGTMLVGPV